MDLVGHIDPYVKVIVGDEKKQTETIQNEPNPSWEQTFTFAEASASRVVIELWDHDRWSPDDLVGRFEFDLNELRERPKRRERLSFEGCSGGLVVSLGIGLSYEMISSSFEQRGLSLQCNDRTQQIFIAAPTLGDGIFLALDWAGTEQVDGVERSSDRLNLRVLRALKSKRNMGFLFEADDPSRSVVRFQRWEEAIPYGPIKVLHETWIEGDVYDGLPDGELHCHTLSESSVEVSLSALLKFFGYEGRARPSAEALDALAKVTMNAETSQALLSHPAFIYGLNLGAEGSDGLYHYETAPKPILCRLGYNGAGYLKSKASYTYFNAPRSLGKLAVKTRVELEDLPVTARPATVLIDAYDVTESHSVRLSTLLPEVFR